MKPKVYFKSILDSKDRKDCLRGLLYCLEPVLSEFKSGQIVGIKTTIGDSKGVTFTKPDIIRVLVERLKALKLKPFVFDTNVIYRGRRMNAVDHLNLAAGKGFSPQKLGCPFIIADGVFGTDSKAIEFKSKHLKDIRVPSLVGVLENLIVVSHVTGHMLSGYAASIKNVAMGMASRAGKQTQHSLLKPSVIKNKCTLCGCCMQICPVEAISEKQNKAFIDSSVCVGCGECISACKFDAIYINWQEDTNIFVERMTDYCLGILSKIKTKLFFNFGLDVTKECDCISGDYPQIVPDAGIFASDDVLAVDKACFDALTSKSDVFCQHQGTKSHLHQFRYAQEIGLGNLEYELVRVK